MAAYIVRRLWQMVPTLLGVVLLVFVLFNWVGGDPAYVLAGKISNPEQIENIRRQLGVDQPYYVQLWIFIKQIVTGDFGASWSTNEKVSHIFATRLGPSLTVLVPLLVIEHAARDGGGAAGRLRARLADRPRGDDRLHGRPVDQHPRLHHRVPVRARLQARLVSGAGLGQQLLAENLFALQRAADHRRRGRRRSRRTSRLYRSFFLDEINQDYVRTARAKGVGEKRIMWVHVLRNASIPIITNVMIQLPGLLAGAFLIERFFSIPGIGREVILAVERSDFPGDQGDHGLCRDRDDGHQSAGRPACTRRSIRGCSSNEAMQPIGASTACRATESPGLWALAWRRSARRRRRLSRWRSSRCSSR